MLRSPQKQWLNIAWKAVAAGEREAMRAFDVRKHPTLGFKAHHEIVTAADLKTNDAIKRVLAKLTPQIPVLSEEGGTIEQEAALRADLAWVLDPIDGTTNYAMRLPLWGISLALIREGEPILGIISLPAIKQRYHAIQNGGAWMGTQQLRVSRTTKLSESIGLLCYGYEGASRRSGFKAVASLAPVSRDTRRLGSAIVQAAWIASGRADYSVLHGINPWDVAAGVLLVREAGGQVVKPSGESWHLGERNVVFAAPGVRSAVTTHFQ